MPQQMSRNNTGAQSMTLGRRDFLRVAGAGVAGLACAATAPYAAAKQAETPLNVMLIVLDDLNDWVGCLGGHPDTKTPNIDRLATRGILFTNAHACATVCGPSRISLLTSVRPSTSGIFSNGQDMRDSPALQNALTLPQHLRRDGYQAVMLGKVLDLKDPDPQSWNRYWPQKSRWVKRKLRKDFVLKKMERSRRAEAWYRNWTEPPAAESEKDIRIGGVPSRTVDEVSDASTASRTAAFLQKDHDRPFFLAVGLTQTHSGSMSAAPKTYADQFPPENVTLPVEREADLADVPPAHQELGYKKGLDKLVHLHRKARRGVANYLSNVALGDAMAGRILDALQASRYADNTLVVLTSDQGYHLGSKERWGKSTLWEESTRVPLIFAGPGITAGRRSDAPVDLADVYPTIAELCRTPPPANLEGHSLKPLLDNPEISWEHAAITTQLAKHHAVRTRRWRYIRYADGSEELYDHAKDPHEWFNLADDPQNAHVKQQQAKHLPRGEAPEIPFATPPKDILEKLGIDAKP